MKQKAIFLIFFCFLIAMMPISESASPLISISGSSNPLTPVSTSENMLSDYILDLSNGDIFISKSPSSDYRSMGDFLEISYGGSDKIDYVPAEIGIRITSNGLPTTNQVIVNGFGLSEQTIIHLILIDTVWDKTLALNENKSGIVNVLNDAAVKITCDKTMNSGTSVVDNNITDIGFIQISENSVRINKESDLLREIVPSIKYLITIFLYFF